MKHNMFLLAALLALIASMGLAFVPTVVEASSTDIDAAETRCCEQPQQCGGGSYKVDNWSDQKSSHSMNWTDVPGFNCQYGVESASVEIKAGQYVGGPNQCFGFYWDQSGWRVWEEDWNSEAEKNAKGCQDISHVTVTWECSCQTEPTNTPEPTDTPTVTPSPTPTASPTPSPTPTVEPTVEPTATSTPVPQWQPSWPACDAKIEDVHPSFMEDWLYRCGDPSTPEPVKVVFDTGIPESSDASAINLTGSTLEIPELGINLPVYGYGAQANERINPIAGHAAQVGSAMAIHIGDLYYANIDGMTVKLNGRIYQAERVLNQRYALIDTDFFGIVTCWPNAGGNWGYRLIPQ